MSKAYVLLAEGFEEVEALTVVDLMRRAGIDVKLVSITDDVSVLSSHNVQIVADTLIADIASSPADMLVLPGGRKGVDNLKASDAVKSLITEYNDAGRYLAAVCAGPTVYGQMGLLEGRKATCYPGFENELLGAEWTGNDVKVACDGNFITGRSLGLSIDFALKLIEVLEGKDAADDVESKIVRG